ncbi:AMP-dependent synthetase/ligase [Dinghuibacter silviterrae]|uniref:Long-chain acyl-CoA synthetase n=1 Tax=Dinghuibacter silviterrae TaxID=1539049 RepID=A0A4R8DRY4_9BACT|nr:long-chain fatty acid--CoA ligase [Dinghuibacter silviterrae]TDW99900.1 long-chain acyl-CoA synthetase [Dinghuibacter silviterrae]
MLNARTRLFDSLDIQLERFHKPNMLAAKEEGRWKTYATSEIKDLVDRLSLGLLRLGVSGHDMTPERQDKIAIISNNRPEWVVTDLAVQQVGAVLTPIYPTTNPVELEFILQDAQVKYMFVNNQEQLDKVRALQPRVPSLQKIFTFDPVSGADHWEVLLDGGLLEDKARLQTIKDGIHPDHLATIIYTSGTTGTPKGVMLSHRNIVSNVIMAKESFPFPDAPETKVLSFLPLNHIFERCVTYIYLFSGISIYYAESMDTIAANLREISPDGFTTVPRLLEKVYERIMATAHELKGIKKTLFFWALRLGEKYDNRDPGSFGYRIQLALANKLIFSKWRAALGNNISFIVTGGAACQERLLRIFNAGRVPVYEGYGPTEHSPVISVNRRAPEGLTKFGSVGPVINGTELKLAEDGEICVKSPSVMMGYYKRPDLTAEVIIDGWLHTGDIGILEEGTFLKITDRKKELFKTSGGKYVAPQAVEGKMKDSPYIEQVMVVGPERKFVGALIVPSFTSLKKWCVANGVPFDTNEAVVREPRVLALFQEEVERCNQTLNHIEQVKKFELLPHEWTVDKGEMTPKLSMKRKVITEHYATVIERIYAEV